MHNSISYKHSSDAIIVFISNINLTPKAALTCEIKLK